MRYNPLPENGVPISKYCLTPSLGICDTVGGSDTVGIPEGSCDNDGVSDGNNDGSMLGTWDWLGATDGNCEGCSLGSWDRVGTTDREGCSDGTSVGAGVGPQMYWLSL